jgi:hypothetical protein
MYIDVILKYGQETAFWNRLAAIGHPKHPVDEFGNLRHKLRRTVGIFFGGTLEDINGDKWVRARMFAEDADKLPPTNNPAFAIMWRSDEFENDELLPEPEAEVETFAIDGNTNGTRVQSVGGF